MNPTVAPVQPTDFSSLDNFASSSSNDLNSLLAKQDSTANGLFSQYQNQVNSQTKLPTLFTQLQTQEGIPQLNAQIQPYKDQILRTQGLISNLSNDVNTRNMGTYATQALRDRIFSTEGGNLNTQLTSLQNAETPLNDRLNSANSQISSLMPLYEQQQQNELKPIESQISSMADTFARQLTGFTDNRQLQLQDITDKITRGEQVTDEEWTAAQDLAKQYAAYQQQLSLQKSSAANSSTNTAPPYLIPPSNTGTTTTTPNVTYTINPLPQLPTPAPKATTPIINKANITGNGQTFTLGNLKK